MPLGLAWLTKSISYHREPLQHIPSELTLTQPPKHTQAEIKSYHRLHGDKSLFCSWLWSLSQLFQSKKRRRKTGRHCHCEIRPEDIISLQIKRMPTFRNFGKVSKLRGHSIQRQRLHVAFKWVTGALTQT